MAYNMLDLHVDLLYYERISWRIHSNSVSNLLLDPYVQSIW